jgi:peptidyl-prolyl cis-trans isomerase D
MLRYLRKGQRWVTAVLVVGLGTVFAIFIGVGGGPLEMSRGGAVVGVGPHHFGIPEFERERAQREAQYREALGESFDAKAVQENLDLLTAQVLSNRALLALEAERLGLSVATPEIERAVRTAFAGEGGRVDRAAFQDWVEYEYGSEQAFVSDQRLELLARKLIRVAQGQTHVSEDEAREAVRRRLESVRIAFAVFDAGKAPEGRELPWGSAEVPAERVAEFLEKRDADARRLYDERKDVYDVPEQVRARHVLVRVAKDAPPEAVAAAEAKARQALERLRAGEAFETVAAELSDDAGSKASGGDLGFFRRGQMVGPFEDAAFALAPGELGEPVRSDFGFHVIRVEETREAQLRSYEAVREELAREILGREAARSHARASASELAAAVRGGKSVEEAAREAGLSLERSGWLRRRPDGYVPGLGTAQELLAAAFALEPGRSSDRIFEVGEKLVLVQVLERREPEAAEVDPVVEAERLGLRQRKLDAQLESWLASRRAELAESDQLFVDLERVRRR